MSSAFSRLPRISPPLFCAARATRTPTLARSIHTEFSPKLMAGHGINPVDYLEYLWGMGYTCSFCNIDPYSGLPEKELPSPTQPWTWEAFTSSFGEIADIPGHGTWGDLLCI